jgi:hypothetical protein
MFLVRRPSGFTQFRFRKRPISRESVMVLNGAMDQEELMLMPVDGFETVHGQDGSLPFFVFSDDDDVEDDGDFEDEDDDFEEEDEDEDDDFDDDFEDEDEDEDEEDDDFEDEDDDFEDEDEDDADYDDFDE